MTHTERMEELLEAERAAEWLQRLEHGGPEVQAEFARWLRESPRHVREVLLATAVQNALKHFNADYRLNLSEIRAKAAGCIVEMNLPARRSPTSNPSVRSFVQLLSTTFRWRRSPGRGGWRVAASSGFVALLSIMVIAIYALSDRTITTAAGEWRNTRLADGSLLRAGPRTKVSIEMTDHQRLVRLAHGEVMVHVARDRARPFYVETDVATARAVGTAFAMRLVESGRASVTVQEGIVAVARGRAPISDDSPAGAVKVIAGQALVVTADGQALIPHTVDVNRDLAWVQQQLVLGANSTVADAIHELNLRNRTQIKLLDGTLGERSLRGVFSASDPAAFAETLERSLPLSVIKEKDTLLLIAQPYTEDKGSKEH
jgi:transmembrane sensor